MSDSLDELAQRLVVGRKGEGRKVFDEAAKAELVAWCARPGISVLRVARQVDVNANQLSRWIREQREGRRAVVASKAEAFVELPMAAITAVDSDKGQRDEDRSALMTLQARLPNGVVVDLRGIRVQLVCELFVMLGRMRCSASTKD